MHNDTIGTLLGDHGFGDPEFIDAVAQRRHVLLDGEFLDALDRFRLEGGDHFEIFAFSLISQQQIGLIVLEDDSRFGAGIAVAEANGQAFAFPGDAGMPNVLVPQQATQIAADRVEALGQRALHVHLKQKMHAAAQVEAEVHRQRMQVGQPLGRTRQQIQGDDILRVARVRVELPFQQVLCLQLAVGVEQANLDAVAVEKDAAVLDAGAPQRAGDAFSRPVINLESGFGAGNLDSRRFAEEVRQGVNQTEHQGDGDENVFPERVAVHGCMQSEWRGRPRGGGARRLVKALSECLLAGQA